MSQRTTTKSRSTASTTHAAKTSGGRARRPSATKSRKRKSAAAKWRRRWFGRRGRMVGMVAAGLCLLGVMHGIDPVRSQAAASTLPAPTQQQTGVQGSAATTTEWARSTNLALSEVDVVQRSFRATGAVADSALIHDYTAVNQTYMTLDGLGEIGGQLEKDFALHGAKVVTRNEGGEHLWEVCGVRDRHTVVTVVLSSFQAVGQPAATVLTVSEQLASTDLGQLSADMANVNESLRTYGLVPQISTCISGFDDARLGDANPKTLVDLAFQAVDATEVEGENTSLVTSISGYTPQTPWHIQTAGGSMNLQVGVHYDAVKKETRVVVGSPIIVVTY